MSSSLTQKPLQGPDPFLQNFSLKQKEKKAKVKKIAEM